MNPLIKWPGGKSSEINKITHLIPQHQRYIEPFFGGGALFFHLNPQRAAINDISQALMEYYSLLKSQDKQLHSLLISYCNSFNSLLSLCSEEYSGIFSIYQGLRSGNLDKITVKSKVKELVGGLSCRIISGFSEKLILDERDFNHFIVKMVVNKMIRTVANEAKRSFSELDLKNNLITGFTSGYYMYFRKVYNDLNLGRCDIGSVQYKAANFYFMREYCYGSMFRYNAAGEFNIPYGGMSYNTKNFKSKIDNMFNENVEAVFKNTDIHCSDFEVFFKKASLNENDFMFLDPPYDTDFSDYEGKDFTKTDQERLASALKKTPAKFILVIKNTDFISSLYSDSFNILAFDNQYTYNVRSRNERNVEHLIITNLPVL